MTLCKADGRTEFDSFNNVTVRCKFYSRKTWAKMERVMNGGTEFDSYNEVTVRCKFCSRKTWAKMERVMNGKAGFE